MFWWLWAIEGVWVEERHFPLRGLKLVLCSENMKIILVEERHFPLRGLKHNLPFEDASQDYVEERHFPLRGLKLCVCSSKVLSL